MSAENAAPPANAFRGFLQGKTRIVMAWIFSFLLIFSARELPVIEGIVICFLGASIRFWGSGYLHKDTELSMGGPYAYTRNPLYFGTMLMAFGTAIAIENMWLAILVLALFGLVYHFIILDEETKLRNQFGESFEKYCVIVPRFFPRLTPPSYKALLALSRSGIPAKFDWAIARKNKAYEAYLAFAALIGFVTVIALVWGYFTA